MILVLGAWCLVLGARGVVLGAWCLVLGAWCKGREAGQGAAGGEEGEVNGRVEAARGAPETGSCGARRPFPQRWEAAVDNFGLTDFDVA